MTFDQAIESEEIKEYLEGCPDEPCRCGNTTATLSVMAKLPDGNCTHALVHRELIHLYAVRLAKQSAPEVRCVPMCRTCFDAFEKSVAPNLIASEKW